jgi:hypothetical protein
MSDLIPIIDVMFGSQSRRRAVIILPGASLNEFRPPLKMLLDKRTSVLACNAWRLLRDAEYFWRADWIFLLDEDCCKTLLSEQAGRKPRSKFVTRYRVPKERMGKAKGYSMTDGEWTEYPDGRPGISRWCWDCEPHGDTGTVMIETAWKLGFEQIDVFGWTRWIPQRYETQKVYQADSITEEPADERSRQAIQAMFAKMGDDGRARLRIHERDDHPYYEYAPECFA